MRICFYMSKFKIKPCEEQNRAKVLCSATSQTIEPFGLNGASRKADGAEELAAKSKKSYESTVR